MSEDLARLPTETLTDRVALNEHLAVRWSEMGSATGELGYHRVQYGDELFDFFEVNDADTATQLREIIAVFGDEKLGQRDILNLRLPKPEGVEAFKARMELYQQVNPKAEVEGVMERLDNIVVDALGLSARELKLMREDLRDDPLFSRMVVRYPFQQKTVRGLLTNLAEADRYQ